MPLPRTHHDRAAQPVPARAGIGLRAGHIDTVLATRPATGWIEVHAENYMRGAGPATRQLAILREHYPVSIHGVGLSLGGMEPLDTGHLDRLAELVRDIAPALVSEHLAWCRTGGVYLNDLLPLPYRADTLRTVMEHVDQVQTRLGRTILIENPSLYFAFRDTDIAEPDFLAEIARRTGCGLLLDVNNVVVSGGNLGYAPTAYLDGFDHAAVGEIHIAGHTIRRLGDRTLRIDDHGSPVAPDVWGLLARTLARTGPVPVLIERDTNLPPLADLLAEAARADRLLDRVREDRHGVAA